MGLNASDLLGAPQVAGSKVTPIGAARQRARVAGGGVGVLPTEIAAKLMFGKKSKELQGSQTPKFGSLGYLAASEAELAIISMKPHGFTGKLNQMVMRVPRSQASAAEMTGAMIGKLVITFTDGSQWAFEVPTQNKKDARAIVELICTGGTVATTG
jgi:hypothetical protein